MAKTRMSPYPVLAEMGVQNPLQIDDYYMTSLNQVDALRIVYDRPKGSLLASSRTYRFPRVPADKAKGHGESAVLNTHPKLLAALDELKGILEAKSTKENLVAKILSEIGLLEEDIAMRAECLRVLARKIPAID
jgi:hypothetical protein